MATEQYVKELKVSVVTEIALQTLRNDRHKGVGIPYYKIGRSVRYKLADVKNFMERHRIEINSE